jgi:hypothetical protein
MARIFNDREFPGPVTIPYDDQVSIAKQVIHEEEATLKQYKRYDNTVILHPLNLKYNETSS